MKAKNSSSPPSSPPTLNLQLSKLIWRWGLTFLLVSVVCHKQACCDPAVATIRLTALGFLSLSAAGSTAGLGGSVFPGAAEDAERHFNSRTRHICARRYWLYSDENLDCVYEEPKHGLSSAAMTSSTLLVRFSIRLLSLAAGAKGARGP